MEKLQIGNIEVVIDRSLMEFNEASLNEYLRKEGPQCDYLLYKLAELEAEYEVKYSNKFIEFKDEGGTEKYVEARCKSDVDLAIYFKTIKVLKNHLKAWDINHQTAQAFGHNLRKELEKLGNEIRFTSGLYNEQVLDILRETNKKEEPEE